MQPYQSRPLPKLDFNITNRCNYRCRHCAFDSGICEMPDLPLEKILEILKDTKELGGRKIDITGGEPTLREDLSQIVIAAKKLDFKVELVTNGSLLTLEKLKELKMTGLDSIAISLDGPDYRTHTSIRCISNEIYLRVLRTIDEVLSLDIPLKINTVAFDSNYRSVAELTEWCITKGVIEHGVYYFTAIGRGNRTGLSSVDPVKWLDYIRTNLYRFAHKIKISIEFPFLEQIMVRNKEIRCLAESGQYHLQILPDGNVYPCAIMASYNIPIANLYSVRIKDIWNNTKLWQDYWHKTKEIFNRCNDSCVDFSDSFDPIKCANEYKFVCPLRKYSVGDIMWDA